MKGKTLNKKAIITIVIIAILLIATISMVVVFLKDQGETEATAIAENNSNGQETQTSVQEDNNNQGTEQQNTEEQDTEPVEDNEPIDDNNNAQVNNNQAQITTTPDSTTTITEETVTVPTEEVNLGWSNITVSGGEQLTNVYALNPEIVSNLEVNKTEVLNQKAKLEYVLNISNNSTDIDAKAIIVTMEVPEGTKFVEAKDAKYDETTNKLTWTVDVNAKQTVNLKLTVETDIYKGEIKNIAVVDGKETNEVNTIVNDNVKPEIIVKGTNEIKDNPYVGNYEKAVYSEVSFKLHDNWMIKEYEINDTLVKITPNAWSDANYQNIKKYLVEGKNVIKLRDMAGNESIYEFTYDTIAPEMYNLGILNKTRYVNKVEDLTYAKTGDEVRILISFQEKLAKEPQVKVFGKEYVATYRKASSNPEKNSYYYMVDIKMEADMPEGEINFEIYGYEDDAKNVGKTLNNSNINSNEFKKVIYDKTAPEIIVKENSIGKEPYFSNISFTLHDNFLVKEYEINGNVVAVSPNAWSDANFQNIKKYLVEGKNVIKLRDMAGNEAMYEFTYDIVAPEFVKVQLWDKAEGETGTIRNGQTVRVNATFTEKLNVLPKLTIGNETVEMKETTDGKGGIIYQADITIKADESTIPEGELPFTISGYEDMAGNVGKDITEADVEGIIYDRTAPVITIKEGFIGTEPYFSNVSFKLQDNYLLKEYEINGNKVAVSANAWSDANFQNIKKYLVEGENTIILRDMAGNEAVKTFVYDITAPNFKPSYWTKTVEADKNAEFTDFPEVSVEDNANGEVVVELVNNTVDMGTPGQYKLQYVTTDISGNKAYNDIFITVVDTTAPTFKPSYWTKTVEADKNAEFTDFPEVSGEDNANGEVVVELVNNTVNMKIPGEYKLQYVTTDASGNKAYNDIFITVVDTTAPIWLGIADGTFTDKDVKVLFEDVSPLDKITVSERRSGKVFEVKNGDILTEEGSYVIEATDKYGNKTRINNITIDKNAPIITGVEDGKWYNSAVTPQITDIHIKEVKLNGENYKVGTEIVADGEYELVATDRMGNSTVVKFGIDTKAPIAEVSYNITSQTKKSVTVRVKVNEEVKFSKGNWTKESDYQYKLVYRQNVEEDIILTDKAGNTTTITIKINNIDKTAPEATVTLSNDNGATMTNKDVLVTLKANELIQDIEGWTRVDDTTFTKVYSENGKYVVEIVDKVGNTSTIKFEVKRIDKKAPVITVSSKNTFEVGVDVYSYPEEGSVYDEFDKEISFSKVNIEWFKATPEGEKGEKVDSFEWNTTLKNRDLGTYYIEYWVSDKAGNVGRAHRLLTLQDTTKPTLVLNGENKQEIELGKGTYNELGATATDNRDETVENIMPFKIDWYGGNGLEEFNVPAVDVNKEGQYNIFYKYTDKAGNYSQIIRKVYVADSTKLEVSAPEYTKLDNGNTLVTIRANKSIKGLAGWTLSEDGKSISKEYTKNTDYLGENITITDLSGKTKKVDVVISDIKENGREVVYIGSDEALRTLAKDINNGKSFKDTTIELTKNINLAGKEWTPIYSKNGVLQNAIIDGNNYTITGMKTSRDPYIANGSKERPYGNGFISDNTCTLTIKNIKFNDVTINDPIGSGVNYSQHYQGTVIGHNQGNVTLNNIKVKNADINGSWQCGGIIGFSATNLVFNNCTVSDSYIGGPNATAGTLFGLGIINATMNNCSAKNIRLYTDSLDWDTNAKRGEGFWVGSLYPSNGTKLTVNNSIESNVTVVDKK